MLTLNKITEFNSGSNSKNGSGRGSGSAFYAISTQTKKQGNQYKNITRPATTKN